MFRRPFLILAFFVVSGLLWWIHEATRLPSGVEAKGAPEWIPWISLIGSIVSLITGLITLGLKIIELRRNRS
jgi:hypothetical protein